MHAQLAPCSTHVLTCPAPAPAPPCRCCDGSGCLQYVDWYLVPAILGGCITHPDACKALEGIATLHGHGKFMWNHTLGGEELSRFAVYSLLHSALNDPLEPLMPAVKL